MEFNKIVKKRASIRRFSSKKPPIEKIIKAIETANLAPIAGNVPTLRYVIIEDNEKIDKITKACQQPWIEKCHYIVLICSDPKQLNRLYDKRADKYMKHNAGAAIENFLLKITDMKMATCWVGAFSDETIKNSIGIPEGVEIEAVLPIGYQPVFDKTKQKKKPTLDNRIYFESYGNKHKKPYGKIGEH